MTGSQLSARARVTTIDNLETANFDLLIIGGGITGAGIAREAALQGLEVAVIEAADFASGTSSRSSKLIHGGLRYLERGEIGLVRKTCLERKEIRKLAPHLADSRWMVIPFRRRAALMSLRVAVTTYEKLGAVERQDIHRGWSGKKLKEMEPALNPKRFRHALAYREYLTDDARLVLANIRSAAAHGAQVLNHARVFRVLTTAGSADAVLVRCQHSAREFRVKSKVIVNATGPWVEEVQRLEHSESRRFLHISKGIHIALPAAKLPVNNLLVLRAADKRRIFAIRRGPVCYLGTTDTTHTSGAQHWPEIGRRDVENLLEPLARYFDIDPVRPEDVVGAWAGLRPLIADPNTRNPSELSRRDELLVGPSGMLSVAGGKLTGYRGMARRVLASVAERLGKPLAKLRNEPPLPGGDFDGDLQNLSDTIAREYALSPNTARRLAQLYGTEAAQVLALGKTTLAPGSNAVTGEIAWAVRHEGAMTLEDVIYRRLRLPLYELNAERNLEPVARSMANALGWDAAKTCSQLAQVRSRMHKDLAFVTDETSLPRETPKFRGP